MQYSEIILTACLIGFLCNLLEAGGVSPRRNEIEGNSLESERRGGRGRTAMMGTRRGAVMGRGHGDKMGRGHGGNNGGNTGTGSSSNSMAGAGRPENFGVTKGNADNMSGKVGTSPGQIMYGPQGGSAGGNTNAGSGGSSSSISEARSERIARDVGPYYYPMPMMPMGDPSSMGTAVNNRPGGIVY